MQSAKMLRFLNIGGFFEYWRENIISGFHAGDLIFTGITEIFLFAVTLLLFIKRSWSNQLKKREEIMMKTAFIISLVLFVCSTFIITPFLRNSTDHSSRLEIEKRNEVLQEKLKTADDYNTRLSIDVEAK